MDTKFSRLRALLKENSIDAILISSLPNITYLTNFSGFTMHDRDAFLLITQTDQYIFTHGIYKEAAKQFIKDFNLIEIKREGPISTALKNLVEKHKINKLGFEAFNLTVAEYELLTKQISKDILQPTNAVAILRIQKTTDEIQALKAACELGDRCFSHILKKVRIGVTEKELAAQLEYFIKSQGATIAFDTIIAFEENAAYPHHVPTDKKLERNSFVLFDFGVALNGYCSDMTRTICFGKATPEKKKIYQTVYNAQQKAVKYISSAAGPPLASAVDNVAREYIISKGFPSMPHSLGHGIGLEVHESPRLTPLSVEKLEHGMVFSIEPGIYLHGNTGVRIEDLFFLEHNNLVQLTSSSSELIEI